MNIIQRRKLEFKLSVFIFLALSIFSVKATEHQDLARHADHKALQLLGEKTAKALNEQDFKTLESCFSRKFVFIPIDERVIVSIEQFRKYYEEIKSDNNYGVTGMMIKPFYDEPTIFTGSDTGYCYGIADNTFILKGNNSVHIKSRWSANFVKESGEWKIALVHSGVNFLDNPMLSAVRDVAGRQIKIYGIIIVLMLALIIYFLIQYGKRRKSMGNITK